MKNFIKNHFDFGFNIPLIYAIITTLLIVPCYLFLPEKYGYENSLIENIQMIVLFICMYFSIKAKNSKKFFWILTLFVIIMLLREINCGRVFFPIPGKVNTFYHWEDIKYGFIVGPIYESFIGISIIIALWNKVYETIFSMLTKTRLPIWNIVFAVIGLFGSTYIDKHFDSCVLEEMVELLMYVAICGIIYLYAFSKDKNIDK